MGATLSGPLALRRGAGNGRLAAVRGRDRPGLLLAIPIAFALPAFHVVELRRAELRVAGIEALAQQCRAGFGFRGMASLAAGLEGALLLDFLRRRLLLRLRTLALGGCPLIGFCLSLLRLFLP